MYGTTHITMQLMYTPGHQPRPKSATHNAVHQMPLRIEYGSTKVGDSIQEALEHHVLTTRALEHHVLLTRALEHHVLITRVSEHLVLITRAM